ncbi:MAG: ABC transporter ATP-binding protein [Fibrobacter sp.]|jgi:iron complex transport system ATP-binding protein|nr:ABC transporter ATP-binding protein [Fibrobacter sp.]
MSISKEIISIQNLHAAYKSNVVLKGISLSVRKNERWAVIGRNGTGKSTLIKAVASIIEPQSGKILVNGKDILSYNARSRARQIAYVPQKTDGVIPYTVYDYIMMGRYSAMDLFAVASQKDHSIVREVLALCNIAHLSDRIMSTLSGGELQRVLLAGAVAQNTPVLLLDEPTTYLDPAHERLFFHALSRVHYHQDLTVIMVTHDINIALSYCTHICGLLDGHVAFCGSSEDFKSKCPSILFELFGIQFHKYSSDENTATVFGAWGAECIQAK